MRRAVRAPLLVCLGMSLSLVQVACSDDCSDAQETCEDCGVDAARCAAEVDQCASFSDDADYSREDCCGQIEASYDPCP